MHAWKRWLAAGLCGIGLARALSSASAADVLVADRLTDSVYRYSADGAFLNVVLGERDEEPESDFLSQPTGLAISPDGTHIYVSSSQTNAVVRYDYDEAAGTASHPFVFATEADGLQFPNAIVFNPDGDTIYVSNLGDSGVARFHLDGSSAGAPLAPFGGGAFNQCSGLEWTPAGELLVGGFVDFPAGTSGAVGKSDAAITTLSTFLGPSGSLMGASGVLVHGDQAYVTGMFASNIQRFNLDDGSLDPSFGVTGLAFPQGLMASPDGNGFLAGILGFANGTGHIAHYDFDGKLIGDGVFAAPGGGGFSEATAFVAVPDPVDGPGDFNGDGIVDHADLATWAMNFGKHSGQTTTAMGDADADGDVDGIDFGIWQRNVSPASNVHSAPVPEPQNACLVIIAACGLATRIGLARRRRTSQRPRCCKIPIAVLLETQS